MAEQEGGVSRPLKKTHMLRCARPISRQRTRRVRLRSSIFARLASEVFLSSLRLGFYGEWKTGLKEFLCGNATGRYGSFLPSFFSCYGRARCDLARSISSLFPRRFRFFGPWSISPWTAVSLGP